MTLVGGLLASAFLVLTLVMEDEPIPSFSAMVH